MKYNYLISFCFSLLLLSCTSCGDDDKQSWTWEWDQETGVSNAEKPRFIWVDAAANFPDFANSKENIRRDLNLAKEAGFTDIVVDVKPPSGDALFKTSKVDAVKWLGAWVSGSQIQVHRTESWDYLQAFIDAGHSLGLRIHAGFNTFTGAQKSTLGSIGLLTRDSGKKAWATERLNAEGKIVNTLDAGDTGGIFFNPVNEEVQNYLLSLLDDLAAYPDLDGIILDRGRFNDLSSDFSEYTKTRFEAYLGAKVNNFPADVMTPEVIAASSLPATLPVHFKEWLEFRVKTIHDFMEKAQKRVKAVNPDIRFGVYVGAWYSSYYGVGVNWASPSYNPAATYPKWASANYKDFGYADLMDIMLLGAYASPTSIYGANEWSVQGFCLKAKDKIKDDVLVIGGPDVGNGAWATSSDEVINKAITESVDAAINACDGYFLFDMIHLKKKNQWAYVKAGIDAAIKE